MHDLKSCLKVDNNQFQQGCDNYTFLIKCTIFNATFEFVASNEAIYLLSSFDLSSS